MGHAVSGQWSQTAEVIVGCGGAVMWASTAWPIILVVLEFSRAEGVEPAATDFSLHLSVMWLPTEMSKKKKENGIKKKKSIMFVLTKKVSGILQFEGKTNIYRWLVLLNILVNNYFI